MCIVKFLVIFHIIYFAASDDLIVQVKNGLIRGRIQTTVHNSSYYAWQGIPYAAPPVGKLRFQAPQPVSNWSGVLDTVKDSYICYQVKTDSPKENEDCLYINVFAPVHKESGNLPVMFWIYGGGFRIGYAGFSGTGPDRLVEQGVIVVTHNYRLGPFGFLSTGDTIVPGNAGLKDQAFALKWTYDNIAAFGGDPNKITIFGQSAGAASVGYQLLSSKNKGLFRAAIQESGSPLNEWASIKDPKPYVANLIDKIDSSANVGNSSEEQLAYLQGVDARKIDAASKTTIPSLTLPVVEVEHEGAFITASMYEAFEAGNYNQVPLIIGCNSEEYIYMINSPKGVKNRGHKYDEDLRILIPQRLRTKDSNRAQMGKEIKSVYLNETELFEDNLAAVIRYNSDTTFTRGVIKQGELTSNYSNVYFYVFSYDGELGGWNLSIPGAEKVMHNEDLKYIWVRRGSNSTEDLSKYPESDQTTSKRIVKMWTDFAKYGNPTPSQSDLLQNITWPTVNSSYYQYLDIDTDLEVKVNPKASYVGWKTTYEKYAERPYITF